MSWPPPPLSFLKVARRCRRCGAGLEGEGAFVLCLACDPPGTAYDEPNPAGAADRHARDRHARDRHARDRHAAANALARRRFDFYAAVLAAAQAAGWTLYRHQRSARSFSLYLEYWRGPAEAGDAAAYLKVRVSDHDRRPKAGGAGFAADWADLAGEFLFDPSLPGPAAAEALAAAETAAALLFAPPARAA